jgi:uncharacterized RDD family membrane protein YckC
VEEIVTGEAVVLDLPCARFPTRTLARLIDLLVQGAAALVILTIVANVGSLNAATLAAVFVASLVVLLVGYPVAFETLSRGRTLGKLALGLRVVADHGGPIRFRQALVRGLAGVIECWALAGVPALITSMLSARGKRLGDVFAGTFVVRERAPRGPAMPSPAVPYGSRVAGPVPGGGAGRPYPVLMPVQPALSPWAAALDLSALPETLAASAASYLSRFWQLDAPARERLAWQLAADVAARVSPPPPPGLPPVTYLEAVLAERRNRELVRLWNLAPTATPAPAAPAPPAEQGASAEEPALPPASGFTPPA